MTTTPTLEELFSETCPKFREDIEQIAIQAGKTPLAVYALWRQYSKECDNADQSALLSEFQDWYKQELMPKQAARIEEYEAKKDAKIERLEEAAAAARERSASLHDQARRMADVIPFGQPILVGHHSEGRDRRYRGRIENKFRKSFEEHEKAQHYAGRAHTAIGAWQAYRNYHTLETAKREAGLQ